MNSLKWITAIDNATTSYTETFGALSPDELNWKPNPYVWSIAQNIDHVITLNSTYYPIINKIRSGEYQVPFIGKIGFMADYFGKLILKSVQPDTTKKIKTFPVWEPQSGEISPDILERFESSQTELKGLINNSQDLLDENIVISSPANKFIVYRLDKAFDIIVAHEYRHLEQAKGVLGILPNRTTT